MDLDIYQNLIEQNKARSDDCVSARFYDRVIKTDSVDANGIPHFKTVCYCEIRIKDNTTEIFDQPADKEKIARFPVEYARYQLSKKQISQGTPLEKFAFLTLPELESCKYHGIFTLEALCNLSSDKASSLNLLKEQKQAQNFLQNNRRFKQLEDIATLKQSYESQIAELKAKIAELQSTSQRRKRK